MTTDTLRNAELLERNAEVLERKAIQLERKAVAAERKAEANFQSTLQTAAFVIGALIGFMVGFAWGMWKAFDIVGNVIQ